MRHAGFTKGIIESLSPVFSHSFSANVRLALALAAVAVYSFSCRKNDSDESSFADSLNSESPVSAEDLDSDDELTAENDIAMTVRSVADAINVGEAIDSAGYNFKGILTDGSGMPLFTNPEGLPGEWEVEVMSPYLVQIRNLNTGDLVSEELVSYISAALQLEETDILHLVRENESPIGKITVFSFGNGTLTVESESSSDDDSNESGDKVRITLRANHPAAPTASSDSITTPKSATDTLGVPSDNLPHGHSHGNNRDGKGDRATMRQSAR